MKENNNIKIVLILMIKNESKILERCIANTLPLIDAVCICDTGSTDNTLEVAREVLEKHKLPYRIFEYIFTDFGESRSKSFVNTLTFINEDLKWDVNNTFGFLVDADMVLKLGPNFDKNFFSNEYISYKILQVQGENEYYNIRLVLMSNDWKCVGKTHECWRDDTSSTGCSISGVITGKNFIWFDDVSDGGCKDDKLERDERLLLKGIEEEPELYTRYCFYLGQTYYCMQKYEKSIEYYLKRSEVKDGFDEEIWLSLLMTCQCYFLLKDYKMTEKYALEAYDFYPCRSEPLLLLTDMFIIKKDFVKAWKYLNMGIKIKIPEKQLLYFKDKTYKYDFYYKKSLLLYHTNPDSIEDIRDCLCHLLNYEKISPMDIKSLETLKALRLSACPIINNNFVKKFDNISLNNISLNNCISLTKNKNYILHNGNKNLVNLDKDFNIIDVDVNVNDVNVNNIKFLSSDIFINFDDLTINNKASEKIKSFLPVILMDGNPTFINLTQKLPHFISIYFNPTLNNFVINDNEVFLTFYSPQILLYVFLIFSLETEEIKYFIPPFCITNNDSNHKEVILSICPNFEFNEINIVYGNVDNNKLYIAKSNIDDILSRKMHIKNFIN